MKRSWGREKMEEEEEEEQLEREEGRLKPFFFVETRKVAVADREDSEREGGVC